MKRVFYLCDGKNENCRKNSCYRNGGECKHTLSVENALNFKRIGKNKDGTFYEKGDVSKNETSPED